MLFFSTGMVVILEPRVGVPGLWRTIQIDLENARMILGVTCNLFLENNRGIEAA